MGANGSTSLGPQDAEVQELVQDLRTATSPEVILKALKKLSRGLNDHPTGGNTALVFVRAGGLLPLIRRSRGYATPPLTPHPDIAPSALKTAAAEALSRLLQHLTARLAELGIARGAVTPLIDAVRDASSVITPAVSAAALTTLANAEPGTCRAKGEDGMLGLVFALYDEIGKLPLGSEELKSSGRAEELVAYFVRSGDISARDFLPAIRSPDAVQAFTALVILQVCIPFRRMITHYPRMENQYV
jgi:hypothetical protein